MSLHEPPWVCVTECLFWAATQKLCSPCYQDQGRGHAELFQASASLLRCFGGQQNAPSWTLLSLYLQRLQLHQSLKLHSHALWLLVLEPLWGLSDAVFSPWSDTAISLHVAINMNCRLECLLCRTAASNGLKSTRPAVEICDLPDRVEVTRRLVETNDWVKL